MRKQAKVTHLVREYTPGQKSIVGVKVETEDDVFTIPVVDVRLSENNRRRANEILKNSNAQKGSRFMKPSYSLMGKSYNVSQKK